MCLAIACDVPNDRGASHAQARVGSPTARRTARPRAIAVAQPGGLRVGLRGQQKTRRRRSVPGMSRRTVQHDSRPHTPEDFERAGGPGFLAPGFLLAAPSHPSRTVASVPRSLPVTVAGAAPELHRLPSQPINVGREVSRAAWRRQQLQSFLAMRSARAASCAGSPGTRECKASGSPAARGNKCM